MKNHQQNQPNRAVAEAFPKRLTREGFPHQPPEGSHKLPSTKANVAHMLKQSGVDVRYDVIKKKAIYSRGDKTLSFADLIGLANLNGQNAQWFADFVQAIAEENPVNPVEVYIRSREWDKIDRLALFYSTVITEPDFPVGLKCLYLDRWLKSAVAAALKDNFKCRGVLTIQGPQGCGKTSWIASLLPAELRSQFVKLDHHLDAHNKDSIFAAVSHWIVEVGELDSSFKKDIARLKGFLTNDCDKLRLPYAKAPIEMPRRTVFAATVNELNFLIDKTGNNRFWTIPAISLDHEHGIDMQQLFAQVAEEIDVGARWWLTDAEDRLLEEHNRRFKAVSVIEERLLDSLEEEEAKPRYMTAIEVLRSLGYANPSNAQCRECGGVLRDMFGDPRRVQGRPRWKVPLKRPEGAWQKFDPESDIY